MTTSPKSIPNDAQPPVAAGHFFSSPPVSPQNRENSPGVPLLFCTIKFMFYYYHLCNLT